MLIVNHLLLPKHNDTGEAGSLLALATRSPWPAPSKVKVSDMLRVGPDLVQGAPARFGELAQRADVGLGLGPLRCEGGREPAAVDLEVLQHARQAVLQRGHLLTLFPQPPCLLTKRASSVLLAQDAESQPEVFIIDMWHYISSPPSDTYKSK